LKFINNLYRVPTKESTSITQPYPYPLAGFELLNSIHHHPNPLFAFTRVCLSRHTYPLPPLLAFCHLHSCECLYILTPDCLLASASSFPRSASLDDTNHIHPIDVPIIILAPPTYLPTDLVPHLPTKSNTLPPPEPTPYFMFDICRS
jgi:hypothetical protein